MPALPGPTHLSIFVHDPATGHPIVRLPLFAEISVPRIPLKPPVDERWREPIRAALLAIDPGAVAAVSVRDHVETALMAALSRVLDNASRETLLTDFQRAKDLAYATFKEALATARRDSFSLVPPSTLEQLFSDTLRHVAPRGDLAVTPEIEEIGEVWSEPLGVLATDHVGYASFDLRRLRPDVQTMLGEAIEKRRNDPDTDLKLAIWVYPYGYPGRFDALTQARFAFDAIVARFAMSWNTLPAALMNMGPRAIQNPSLTDWRLSPASFAANPNTLAGQDGCEELLPASLALQEFVLRQVVRLTDVPDDFDLPDGFKAAYVDDYRVSWFSLGHSLGEILYSLPLAPGESVRLAVIDWSWNSLTQRDENTKLTEDVLHQTHRDRTITETVKAGLKELQHGSSFMAGTASAAGGSGGANLGVVGLGAAVGNTWSVGGSTATSDGSRNLAAENVQRLNDSFSQASSAQREINSTVVIQARQEEKESVQTRTFSNYNHSHTLTVLYYEVLRHYRVTVEWVRRRPAVLVQIPERVTNFDAAALIGNRALLVPNLLDASLQPAFDLLEKQETIRENQALNNINPSDDPVAQFWEGDIKFSLFNLVVMSPDDEMLTGDKVVFWAIKRDGTAIELDYLYFGPHANGEHEGYQNGPQNINSGGRFDDGSREQHIFVRPKQAPGAEPLTIRWADLAGFQFEKWGDKSWRIIRLGITGFDTGLAAVPLLEAPPPGGPLEVYHELIGKEPSSQTVTFIRRPGPFPAPIWNRSPEKSLSPEERHQVNKLVDHFNRNKDYYNRILLMGTDPTSIAIAMEGVAWGVGKLMSDHVDPTPLEVFGSYVAYPLAKKTAGADDTVLVDIAAALNGNDPARRQWAVARIAEMSDQDRQTVSEVASAKSERLITLPTRGVFAEGKLGHCNISEEIDNTRFWKWEEHPIPIEASGINPITPITPQPQAVNIAPTPFPQSLVNIVNPSPAPDPTGLAAALNVLGTPNIFRDMSGRSEVADLLKKLSDNSISIAEAANQAREIQQKYGSTSGAVAPTGKGASGGGAVEDGGANAPGTGTTRTPTAATRSASTPEQRTSQQIDNQQKVLEAARDYLAPDQQAQVRDSVTKELINASAASGQGGIPFYINPDVFDFKPGPPGSNWQETSCVSIVFGYGSSILPMMRLEVGVVVTAPLELRDGHKLSVREAQLDSANAAQAAAEIIKVMLDSDTISPSAVQPRFVGFMGGAIMSTGIGYRVKGCYPKKNPPKTETGGPVVDV